MIEALINAPAHALGHDCHVMFGADAASALDDPKTSLLGFSLIDYGNGDRIYRGLDVTLILSRFRVHPRSI